MTTKSPPIRSREPTPLNLWNPWNVRGWLRRTAEVDDAMRGRPPAPGLARASGRATDPLARPLFVLGAPRSGTSLLGDLVGSLPEFSYHYEPPLTKAAARYVHDRLWSEWRARVVYRSLYRWLMSRVGETSRRFAEKTPQNCFVVAFLARTFGDAQFLHIVRDGRDAALSYAEKPWLTERGRGSGERESGGYPHGPFARFWVEPARVAEFESTSDLHRCIWAWRRHVEAAQDGSRAVSAGNWLEVRYEELTRDPVTVGERVLDFLGITADPSRRMLRDALSRVRADSVRRHEHELDAAGRAIVAREAGDLLRRLGYADDLPSDTKTARAAR